MCRIKNYTSVQFVEKCKLIRVNQSPSLGKIVFKFTGQLLAKKYLPSGRNNSLPWPLSSMMFSTKHKVLYIPIAKCGCSSLKDMMLEMAEVEHKDVIRKVGLHAVADRFNTGLQLKDIDLDSAIDILAEPEYFRFSVIREPMDRLISAYLEKFVRNRQTAGNQFHTSAVLAQVQGVVDHNVGITFRQFVEYIVSSDPNTLDTHWIPQSLYLEPLLKGLSLYRLDELDQLKSDLGDLSGCQIDIGHTNKTRSKTRTSKELVKLGRFVDSPPLELDDVSNLSAGDFMLQEIVQLIENAYHHDVELYHSTYARVASANLIVAKDDYYRQLFSFISKKKKQMLLPLSVKYDLKEYGIDVDSGQFWNTVGLMSKGVCVVTPGVKTFVPVIISSPNLASLSELVKLNICIGYRVLDASREVIYRKVEQSLGGRDIGGRPIKVPILLPKELDRRPVTIQFSLVVSGKYWVSNLVPLHACWSRIVSAKE
jgi:hypothetical protein